MAKPIEPSEALVDMAILGLEHGVRSVEEGGPLVPFVIEEKGSKRDLHRFVTDTLEEGVARALEHAASRGGEADRVAVAWDGYLTANGVRRDAIFVRAFEAGDSVSHIFAQAYEPAKGKRKAEATGNPALVDQPEPLF